MAILTSISFVRHGHVFNPQNVFYGHLPGISLSEEGRRQARSAGEALHDKPLVAIFSSPLLRTRQTAEIILESHENLTLRISSLLNEIKTPFDGRPISEMANRNWDVYSGTDLQYEQPIDVLRRVQRFVARARQQYEDQHIVAVTHGDLIAFMMLWAKSMPIAVGHRQTLYEDYLAPGSITTFVYETAAKDSLPSLKYLKPY